MPRGLADKTIQLIDWCREELEVIQPAGVRAVAYQLVSHRKLASMAHRDVKRVERALGTARERGRIRWKWIVDDTRQIEVEPSWAEPEAFVADVVAQYRKNRWARQPYRVFILCEKNTIRGSILPVLKHYGVEFLPLRGFSSKTKVHELAEMSQRSRQPILAFYLGDHDPSGMRMSEVDLPKRLTRYGQRGMRWKRIAITREQIDAERLMPIAAKPSDPRYKWYVPRYGTQAWELDALNPNTLRTMLAREIEAAIDPVAWEHDGVIEAAESDSLRTVLTDWQAILHHGQK